MVVRVRTIVLADTHIRGPATEHLPRALLTELDTADIILHAGDVTTPEALASLRDFAPVYAVLGNNDLELVGELEERAQFDLDGIKVAMLHDSGTRTGRDRRMKTWFPTATIVVYGHSHQPDRTLTYGDQLLFNPGSATTRRMQPKCSYGVIETDGGVLLGHRIEFLD